MTVLNPVLDPLAASVVDRVLDHVRANPDQTCLRGPDGEITYRQLDAVSQSVADLLAEHGVTPGEIVAIDAPRSALVICLALGVWRAGAAFLLFDPVQPPARRAELLADARVRLRLGVNGTQPEVDVVGTDPVPVPADLAYVVYTSGSTGAPKGVLVPHRGVPQIVTMGEHGFGIAATDRFAMLAPLHVEAAVFEFAVPLAIGARVEVPEPGAVLTDFLREREVTALVTTPTRLADLDPAELPGLRLVISAGEELTPELARVWANGRRLVNGYGITEVTICSAFAVIPPDVRRVPIGKPIAPDAVRVLDDELRPVAPGGQGEMYLGGLGVTAGYLGQPELTAKWFVEVDGEVLYKSGDYAEIDADGVLYFTGRRDDQVQIGGYRVEPGEARAVLHGHPSVHDCAVIARDQRLIAYVVPHGTPAPAAALRDWLSERLPAYLVPTRYVDVPELPRTAWGKVDQQALPEPESLAGAAAASPLEAEVAAVVGDLLDGQPVGAERFDEDLFLLGMTSVLVARLIRRVDTELGVRLSPVDVFEHPTVRELAEIVAAAR
ncbi:non-ribosomal peptide synthetase [Actinokineospora inagensis]|uniref:non-ribosomal peptide synthetase n=1 Tax=Actinokineospora inagensis TaxID=103730 RepID=UPI00040457DC|nr:non-ribosomal peptide synthetase [Actinokineospora inagensis]